MVNANFVSRTAGTIRLRRMTISTGCFRDGGFGLTAVAMKRAPAA